MGGAVALAMAAERPQATRALVLVAPAVSGRLRLAFHLLLDSRLGRRMLGLALWRNVLNRLASPSRHRSSWLARNPARLRDVRDLARTSPEAAVEGLRAVTQFDFTSRLPDITAPALVIVGTHDATLPPSEAELAAARIPGARLVQMRGVGHQPVDERPEEFDRLLLEFVTARN